jgi:hypothetical protein
LEASRLLDKDVVIMLDCHGQPEQRAIAREQIRWRVSSEKLAVELGGRDVRTARLRRRLPYSACEGPVAEILGSGVCDQVAGAVG